MVTEIPEHFGQHSRSGLLSHCSIAVPGAFAGVRPCDCGTSSNRAPPVPPKHGSAGHVWMAPGWQGFFSRVWIGSHLRSCVRPAHAAEAAGPDGSRGSRPDQAHGVALPLDPRKVALDPSVDRRCHHASSPSQVLRAWRRRPFRPPPCWPGNPPGASSAPSRCAPSCWPGQRPPPCAPCWPAT